jgi:hypothetical protein
MFYVKRPVTRAPIPLICSNETFLQVHRRRRLARVHINTTIRRAIAATLFVLLIRPQSAAPALPDMPIPHGVPGTDKHRRQPCVVRPSPRLEPLPVPYGSTVSSIEPRSGEGSPLDWAAGCKPRILMNYRAAEPRGISPFPALIWFFVAEKGLSLDRKFILPHLFNTQICKRR